MHNEMTERVKMYLLGLSISFFESNVCIPKGENRHPFADVLHEWVENQELKLETQLFDGSYLGDDYIKNKHFRIKPSNPVYEWQLYRISSGCPYVIKRDDVFPSYFTDEEIKHVTGAVKFEETKRERK